MGLCLNSESRERQIEPLGFFSIDSSWNRWARNIAVRHGAVDLLGNILLDLLRGVAGHLGLGNILVDLLRGVAGHPGKPGASPRITDAHWSRRRGWRPE